MLAIKLIRVLKRELLYPSLISQDKPAMLHSSLEKSVCVILFTLCLLASNTLGQEELPVEIPPVTIPGLGAIGQCPLDGQRQAAHETLRNTTREIVSLLLNNNQVSRNCGPGNWRRVFYLNTSTPDQVCPGQWRLVTSPVRSCVGANSTCRSAYSDVVKTAYSKVCGRIIGESFSSPDGFIRFISTPGTIEDNYLDGVGVTHGDAGSRTHIWSFGAGRPAGGGAVARCPCDNTNRVHAPLPPAEVGNNYFCDRADQLDRLWTGEGCMADNPCCSFHNPPYFSVQLPAATTDTIELRICIDQHEGDETIHVLFAEIYVQ